MVRSKKLISARIPNYGLTPFHERVVRDKHNAQPKAREEKGAPSPKQSRQDANLAQQREPDVKAITTRQERVRISEQTSGRDKADRLERRRYRKDKGADPERPAL